MESIVVTTPSTLLCFTQLNIFSRNVLYSYNNIITFKIFSLFPLYCISFYFF
ncbi:hypothetical protein H8356DRAFT_1732737 [Neocallimastix lanati (nom. inval.)]|nr:hypothetical protein H8356DRAFT_1732737 [Neocallimastix sp. JGI-2020a]